MSELYQSLELANPNPENRMKKMLIALAVLNLAPGCSTIRDAIPQSAQTKADYYGKYESYTEAKLELIRKRKEYWQEQAAEEGAE